MELLFASSNVNKVKEIRQMMPDGYHLLSLADLHFYSTLEETGSTIEENALQKARFIYDKFGRTCFSDDSGLEVEALGGQPGVNSAYYAGVPANDQANMELLLKNMQGLSHRKAAFRTVIALIHSGQQYLFEGRLNGVITTEARGNNGFGYDPVFLPDGYNRTLAELSRTEKNAMSHRYVAIAKLKAFLHNLNK